MAQKKPPMSIKELEKKTNGEDVEDRSDQPGTISYVGEINREEEQEGDVRYTEGGKKLVKRKKGKSSKSYNLLGYPVEPIPILLSVIVSLVVTIIMIAMLAGSKDDVNYLNSLQGENRESINSLSTNLDSISSSILDTTSRLDNVINAQGQYAKKSYVDDKMASTNVDFGNYVTQDNLETIEFIMMALRTDLDEVEDSIDAIYDKVIYMRAE